MCVRAQPSTVWQDVATQPTRILYWSFAHAARTAREIVTFEAAPPPGRPGGATKILATASAVPANGWVTYSGNYTVPSFQTTTRFLFRPRECYFQARV